MRAGGPGHWAGLSILLVFFFFSLCEPVVNEARRHLVLCGMFSFRPRPARPGQAPVPQLISSHLRTYVCALALALGPALGPQRERQLCTTTSSYLFFPLSFPGFANAMNPRRPAVSAAVLNADSVNDDTHDNIPAEIHRCIPKILPNTTPSDELSLSKENCHHPTLYRLCVLCCVCVSCLVSCRVSNISVTECVSYRVLCAHLN